MQPLAIAARRSTMGGIMVSYARRNIAIVTSVGAMAVSVMLMIFFGAWAVSASGDAGVQSLLSGATAGFSGDALTAATAAGTDGSATAAEPGYGDTAPRLASAASGDRAAADTWWGKAFLTACPLH